MHKTLPSNRFHRLHGAPTLAVLATIALLLAILGGCGGSTDSPITSAEDVQFTLADRAVLIGDDSPIGIVSATDDEVRLSGATRSFVAGDVLNLAKGDGSLHKVKTARKEGSTWILSTEPAALTEAFKLLQAHVDRPLSEGEVGSVTSSDPAAEVEWVNVARSPSKAIDFEGPALKVTFKGKKYGDHSLGVTVSGIVYVRVNPILDIDLSTAPGDTLPKLHSIAFGANPELAGDLTVEGKYAGSVGEDDKELLQIPLRNIKFGPITLSRASVAIKGSVVGIGKGKFKIVTTPHASARAWAKWSKAQGWQKETSVQPTITTQITDVNAELEMKNELRSELRFDLFGIAGPYVGFGYAVNASGIYEDNPDTGNEAVHVIAKRSQNLVAGIEGSLSSSSDKALQKLRKLIDVQVTLFEIKVPIDEVKFFDQYFDIFEVGSILVSDNGTANDDIFEVRLDGEVLGRTPLGSEDTFRVNNLSPGRHELTITAIETGEPGNPGTLGVRLNNGLTFENGNTTYSDELTEGGSRTIAIVAPDGGRGVRSIAEPMPRNLKPER